MRSVRSGGARHEALVVAAALAALYLLTLTANHSEAEDALGYAAGIREGAVRDVLHPHHVLWGALGWCAHNAARALGYDGGSLGVLQVLNALIGAGGVGLLWAWLRGLGWRPLAVATACGLVAFSYGYWFYSGEAEVYVLSAALLVTTLMAALRAAREPTVRSFAVLGLVNGLAVLAHDTNVIFAAVALAALLIGRTGAARADIVRRFGAYGLTAAAIVLPVYAVAALANGRETPGEARSWISGYAESGQWGKVEASSAPKAVVGAGRALVGGHSAFAIERAADAAESAGGRNPREELFLARDYPAGIAAVLLVLAGVVAALAIASAVRLWRGRHALDGDARALALLSVTWAVAYALFFTWWEPVNIEFWIATWIPLAILLALPFATTERPRDGLWAGALVGLLAAVNLAGSIIPAGAEGDDYWRVRTDWYAQHGRPGDLVVTNNYVQSNYVRYRAPEVGVVDGEQGGGRTAVLAARGWSVGRVLVSREAFEPDGDRFSSCAGGDQCERAELLRRELQAGARVLARPPLETVWEIPVRGGAP